MVRRRRGRRRPALRRRTGRRMRVKRIRTFAVVYRFGLDGGLWNGWGPADDTSLQPITARQSQINTTGNLPAGAGTGPNAFNAILYAFEPYLNDLRLRDAGFNLIRQQYDQQRLLSFAVVLKVVANPKYDITTAMQSTAASYDFSTLPDIQPDFTWLDYDGVATLTDATTGTLVPSNGDETNNCQNRQGLKKHRAFRTIFRVLKPKCIEYCSAYVPNPTLTPSATTQLLPFVSNKKPWLASNAAAPFYGRIFLAISYKGGQTTTTLLHPYYFFSMRTYYRIEFRAPLYG